MENYNCQYTDNDIWNYYSNLLSREEEANMQEHILACGHCKQRLHHLRGIAESLDDEDTDVPSTEEAIGIKKKHFVKRYLVLAASAVAAIVLLFQIISPNKGENMEDTEDTEHPVYNVESPSYSRGDTLTSDSTDVVFGLDTLSVDQ